MHKRSFLIVVACGVAGCSNEPPQLQDFHPISLQVSDKPLAVIGGMDPRPGHVFGQIVGATRLVDGHVLVADAMSSELRVFTESGEHVSTFGGQGDGPGELRRIMTFRQAENGNIAVLGFRGLTWFTETGDFIRTDRVNWTVSRPRCRIAGPWRLAGDGRAYTVFEDNPGIEGCPPIREGLYRSSGLVALVDLPGAVLDSLTVLPATERNGPSYRVYGNGLIVAEAGDRLYTADSAGDSIFAFDRATGRALSPLPIPFQAQAITVEAKAELDRVGQRGGFSPIAGTPDVRPETYPKIARILGDPTGRAWVMQAPPLSTPYTVDLLNYSPPMRILPGTRHWKVLAPNGDVLGDVETPAGLYVLEVGLDYVLGITMNEFDVVAVQLHELHVDSLSRPETEPN